MAKELSKNLFSEHDSTLIGLLDAAAEALRYEDEALNKAFDSNKKCYAEVSQGLNYYLFETTLVYLIFKSWIPRAHVVWDSHKGKAGGAIDLTVFEGSNVRYAFEAKWWNCGKAETLFWHDVTKLRSLEGKKNLRTFLLAFWWVPTSDFKKNDDIVSGEAKKNGWKRVYQAYFCTHVKDRQESRFVIDVIEV